MNEGDIYDTEKAARQKLAQATTLRRRFARADRERLMRHAESLEAQMRVLAALLESRDHSIPNGGTPTSIRAIAEAKRLARIVP